MQRLIQTLLAYDTIVYERVWDRKIIEHLRTSLPGRTFVYCTGEHALQNPIADYVSAGELRHSLPALLAHLQNPRTSLPADTIDVHAPSGSVLPRMDAGPPPRAPARLPHQPNLRPIIIDGGASANRALPVLETYPITASGGCAYQTDARENPLYAGVTIPARFGRGCSFCTIGNRYEPLSPADAVTYALEQITHVRTHAPERNLLRLKDQNPFAYLEELVEACADASLGDFALLLETRADWMLRNRVRFAQALAAARRARIRLAPYLVGIENFAQPELDRFNKGATVATNIEFIEQVWRWAEEERETFDLRHASFGFILFTPWTTLADLRENLAAVVRTRFDRLRGSLLLSRVRLYPDNALYYLAERDGLLTDAFADDEADSSRRYGYYPAQPWRFARPEVSHFAALAATVSRQMGGRDELRLWQCLCDAFAATARPEDVTSEQILGRLSRRGAGARAHTRLR